MKERRSRDISAVLSRIEIRNYQDKKGSVLIYSVFLAYAFYDSSIFQTVSGLHSFWVRLLALVSSHIVFSYFKKSPREKRNFYFVIPIFLALNYFIIREGLESNIYMIGLVLTMFTHSLFLPTNFKNSFLQYFILTSPLILTYLFRPYPWGETASLILNQVGVILVVSINGAIAIGRTNQRLKSEIELADEVVNRDKIIEEKTQDLLKQKEFQKQFSPQITEVLLKDETAFSKMTDYDIVIVVFDLEESTKKISTIESDNYYQVVESIFDIIGEVSLKNNLTIDKFTGDGAQVFAGSPVGLEDDIQRCFNASNEVLQEIEKHKERLEPLWGSMPRLKISIVQGGALVGFLGTGAISSFTALGTSVSLAHRICSQANGNEILAYVRDHDEVDLSNFTPFYELETKNISGLKGLGDSTYNVISLKK